MWWLACLYNLIQLLQQLPQVFHRNQKKSTAWRSAWDRGWLFNKPTILIINAINGKRTKLTCVRYVHG